MSKPRCSGRKYNYDAVLEYVRQHKAAHDGNSPTHREIMQACGVSSTSQVHYILATLEADGKLVRVPGTARSLAIPGANIANTRG